MRYLVVQNNIGQNWGGQNQAATTPVGLVLVAGVQYSTFTGNVFDGSTDTRASYGLQIRSSFNAPSSACHHNTFLSNTFRAYGGCFSGGCRDVFFVDDGPDQGFLNLQGYADIGKRYVNTGNNAFSTMDWNSNYDHGCLQFAHAFFVYPSGQNFVNRGQSITLAAAGIRPGSSLPISFKFYGPVGNLVTTVQYPGGNDSCVLNQQTFQISSSVFVTPGLYKVLATYYDGNSNAQIVDDWIGTGGQQVFLDIRDAGCTYTIDKSSDSFPGNGGNGTFSVATSSSCGWGARSSSDFITITSGTGAGNGTVSYSVAPNPIWTIRSGTITVGMQTFTVYQGIDFSDVPLNHPYYTEIGKISARSVTLGCATGMYCPDNSVTRQEMAAFIVRGLGELNPPTPPTQRFVDVPPSNVFYNFIDRLAVLGVTVGCGANPPLYCPADTVLHEQMAAFMLRARGEFNPPAPPSQRFNDVPPANVFYNFIDRMFVLDIWPGCSTTPPLYCPSVPVTRGQMAHILVKAFNL